MSGEGVIPSRIEILPRVQRDADGLLWTPVSLASEQEFQLRYGQTVDWKAGELLIQEFPLPEEPPHCIHCDVQLTAERWDFLLRYRPDKLATCNSDCRSQSPFLPESGIQWTPIV